MQDNYNGPRLVSDRSDSDEATVARLMRLAGHRPAVPARDAEIVRQAARAEWLRAVKAQRRRAFFLRGGGLLAAAALVLLALNTDLAHLFRPGAGKPVATVAMMTGAVSATAAEARPAPVALGATLLPDTTVQTAAAGAGDVLSRVGFKLAGGASIRRDADTSVRIVSGSVLELERGALYADSDPTPPAGGRSLEIRTEFGVARDVGTQFVVRLGAPGSNLAVQVQVREGEVSLDRDDGKPLEVSAGQQLSVLPGGSVDFDDLPSFGGSWGWVLDVLPPYEADGRKLHEVLEWAAREAGWQLSYADSTVARIAAVTDVSGKTAGLTLEEIVGLCVPGSGLSSRLEDGVFTVE